MASNGIPAPWAIRENPVTFRSPTVVFVSFQIAYIYIYPNFWWRWVKILYQSSTKSKHNDWNPGDSWFRRMVFMVLMLSESRFRGKCVELCSKRHNVSSWKYPIVHWTNGKKGYIIISSQDNPSTTSTTPWQCQRWLQPGLLLHQLQPIFGLPTACQRPTKDIYTSPALFEKTLNLRTSEKTFAGLHFVLKNLYTKSCKTPQVWSWILFIQYKTLKNWIFLGFC